MTGITKPVADTETESYTAIEPVDWLKIYLNIFKDDEDYGFANRWNPEANVIKDYSVIMSEPELANQHPFLWVTYDEVKWNGVGKNTPIAFLRNFTASTHIFVGALANTFIQYNGYSWSVPCTGTPDPDKNLLELMVNYVGMKIKDNFKITGTGYTIQHSGFNGRELYIDGLMGIREARAVRLGIQLEVQLDG